MRFGPAVLTLLMVLVSGVGVVVADDEAKHTFTAGALEIVHPWARAAAAGGETLVFMEILNAGGPDRLVGAETGAAQAVHIVGLTLRGDAVTVQEVGPVVVPAGDFDLDPGGLALELHGLAADLAQGAHFDMIVHFETAGPVTIEVAVEAADARQHSHAGHSH